MTQTIDAAAFQQMVIHAAAAINAQKQHINDLNVFPVPDGDTGTNMSLTISAAAAELKKKQCATVGEAAQTAASRPAAGRPGQLRRHPLPAVPRHCQSRSRTGRPSTAGIWPSPWTSAWPPPIKR